jgi:hypothetical protein
VNRLAHSYVVAAASGTVVIVAAVVAFAVMLISLQGLKDWPALGLHLGGGDSGSSTSGTTEQAVSGARAIHAGGVGISPAVATGAPATAATAGAGRRRHPGGGTETGGAGRGAAAVSPAIATTPVQSPPPNSPSGGNEVTAPEGGSGPAGGGGGEGGGAPHQTAPTPPTSTRNVSPEPDFGACQLQGEAQFSPGLTSSSQPFGYILTGSLEGCRSSQSGAPAGGTLSAGQAIPEQVTNSVTGAVDTVIYQEPIPTGSGSCESSTTQGQVLEAWADGTETVVSYSTTGALSAVHLSGSVAPSMTLSAVNPAPGDPVTFTISTTRFAGESAVGLLAFQPPEPTACTTPAGATTTAIGGFIGLGSS